MTTRRTFLQIAGLSAAAFPLLSRFTRTAFAAGSDAPKRFIALYSANGTVPEHWQVSGAGPNFAYSRILKPLEPYRDSVTVIKNLGYNGFNTPHSMGTMKALTARDTFDARPSGTERGVMTGPSLETELAHALGSRTARDALRLSVSNATGTNRAHFNFTRDGQYIRPQDSPQRAFEFLFPAAGSGGGVAVPSEPVLGGDAPARAAALLKARQKIVDVVREDAKRIQRALPPEQRFKMEAVLSTLKSHQERLLALAGGMDPDTGEPIVPIECDAQISPGEVSGLPAKTRAQMDNIVAAFGCDVTRFATLMMCPGADSSSHRSFLPDDRIVGGNRSWHDASHDWEKADDKENLTRINEYFATQMAYLVGKLKSVQDADGRSLLENTVVLWTNECWHGNHQPNPIPIVMAGAGGGYFKTGHALEVPDADSTRYGLLLAEISRAMGHDVPGFGDHTGSLPVVRA